MTTYRLAAVFVLVVTLSHLARPATAGVIITITQVGSDVVATGSGTIDVNDLILAAPSKTPSGLDPAAGTIAMGPPGNAQVLLYSKFNGPASFGTGGQSGRSQGSGDIFGFSTIENQEFLIVPSTYGSQSPLSATDTYSGQTFSSLGLTPGTYTWNWGTGKDADFLTVQIGAVPEPTAAVLAVIGAGTVIVCRLARKRQAQRRQAAA
jgi:hypothetical protein